MKIPVVKASAAVIAAPLLVLGLPQTVTSAWRLWAADSLDPFALTPAQLGEAAEAAPSLERLDERMGDPDSRILAAEFRIDTAPAGDADAVRQEHETAAADLESGLARLPANDAGWYQLAYARLRLDDRDGARTALRTSMLFGYYDPQLNYGRLWLGLQLWLSLDAADIPMVRDQARFAWLIDSDKVTALARSGSFQANVIRNALDEDARAKLDQALSRP